MQAAEAAMIESPPMVKPYKPGVDARRAILRELRRRELAGEPAPSTRELAPIVGLGPTSIWRHVASMRAMGWASVTTGRTGAVYLTEEGRNAASML